MALTLTRDGNDAVLAWRFGGGLHTALTPEDIGDRESAAGKNQDLQLDRAVLQKRKPIELVGTAPNAATIRGFADLQNSKGENSALIQAGQRVYRWFGGAASYDPKAAEFDGANDNMLRGAGLTGAADGKSFMLGKWIFGDDVSSIQEILQSTGDAFRCFLDASGKINITAENAAGTKIVDGTATTALTISTWTYVLISCDLGQGRLQIFLNDTDVSDASPTVTFDDIDFTVANWAIGSDVSETSGTRLNARLSEFYFNIGESVDITVEDTRRMFFGESSTSRDLGKQGKNPTGNQPDIYIRGNETTFQVNHGTGGNFTVTGTLSAPATNPPDGSSFVRIGTVPLGARLRGGRESTSLLDDLVVITDLALLTDVKTWDGKDGLTSFADLAHNLGGTLRAKYAMVEDERLHLANLRTTTNTPHVLLASKRSSIVTFTEANRPSSSLSAEDAYFLPIPDFKPINALLAGLGLTVLSTEKGRMWKLTGADATDFALKKLFTDSSAEGEVAVANIGNDIIFGRHGKIDSLVGAEAFGDVETDDVSRWISDEIKNVTKWEIIYNPRLQRAYCWPLFDNGGRGARLYVFAKALFDPVRRRSIEVRGGDAGDVSPWMRWETTHGEEDFFPTGTALMRNPDTGLDHVYYGDDAGRIFQLEGSGLQDAGSVSITTERISPLVTLPGDRDVYEFEGWILYEEHASTNIVLTMQYQGSRLDDGPDITIPIPDPATFSVFGGSVYFGGSFYFGVQFDKRLNRQRFSGAGAGSAFQIKASISTDENLAVHEIGLRLKDAPP